MRREDIDWKPVVYRMHSGALIIVYEGIDKANSSTIWFCPCVVQTMAPLQGPRQHKFVSLADPVSGLEVHPRDSGLDSHVMFSYSPDEELHTAFMTWVKQMEAAASKLIIPSSTIIR